MTYPLNFAGRSLVALLLIATGLSTFGCGDSATVTESAALGSLSVSPGKLEPPFNPATTSYIARIPFDALSTTITASPQVSGDTIRFDNQQTTSQTITLASPQDTPSVTIVVTDTGTGGTSRSYSVRVEREVEDTALSALTVSPGTLSPSTFDKNNPNYAVNGVDNTVRSITISATKSDSATVMQIGSVTVPAGTESGQAIVQLGGTGSATEVPITLTAPGGSTNTYTVTINRGESDNNFLRSLAVSSGGTALSLVPRFSSGSPDYTVNVASNTSSVSVTPRLDDTTATMTVDGRSATSGQAQAITLLPAGQDTLVKIRVIAQDNSPAREYSVNVKRAALGGNKNLSALTISPGPLDFNANTLTYTVNVGSNVLSVDVSATKADRNATMSQDVTASPGTARGQATISLGAPGSTTPVLITVQAPNGDSQTYRINVVKAALGGNNDLSALTISPGSLTFRANTLTYTVNVGSNVSSVDVSATKADRNATMSQDVTAQPGTATGRATIPLGAPGSTTPVLIAVTAPNGSSQTYRINVVKDALSVNNNLSALRVSANGATQALSPRFDRNELVYTVNVANAVTEVTVSATKDDPNATISGSLPNEGQATIPLTMPPGEATPVTINVTAQDATSTKTYTIGIIRAEPTVLPPQDPTDAPDLRVEDDPFICIPADPPDPNDENACDPIKSDATTKDNITNITSPRFTIPQPGTGETAILYINGNKDESSSTTGNTLRPSAPLSEGEYLITYTLTNAGGESNPSPPLNPSLRIITAPPPPPGS